MHQLANSNKYVTVSEWQGGTRIHIRTYFKMNDDSEPIPTKKGVAMTIDEWRALKSVINHVDTQIAFYEDQRMMMKQPDRPDSYQYTPTSEKISKQLLSIRRCTPYQQPFDQ
jgi:hypothetical protein